MNKNSQTHSKIDLEKLAEKVMKERGLQPNFAPEVDEQLRNIKKPAPAPEGSEDLRGLLWCSIDNDDSRDLDQLTYAEKNPNGTTTIWVAIADVDALVHVDTPIDHHARHNTTSVYTPAKMFPMLPEKLSTDLTSLNENEDRLAMVSKVTLGPEAEVIESNIFRAIVRNKAQLAYPSLGAWLQGEGPLPEKAAKVEGLAEALKCQNQIAQILRDRRHSFGALTLESPQVEAKVRPQEEVILRAPSHNPADQLIEHFMIASNHAIAEHFLQAGIPSLRRVVRVPKRWDRIVAVAKDYGFRLPKEPDSKELEKFLVERKKKDPVAFPDLSLTIIKLLGRGEYVVEKPREKPLGHFGLALSEYTHSSAPNRRFPDLITQRQFKAHLLGVESPYSLDDLKRLAVHCTEQEDAATKVERHLNKSAAALMLASHIGNTYSGIVTGRTEKGTWARIFTPPVEGKIVRGYEGLDIGDRIDVQLLSVDIVRGFIDFAALGHRGRR